MKMNRRKFLKGSTSALTLSTLPSILNASTPDQPTTENWSEMFQAALQTKPWLSGFKTATNDQYEGTATIAGDWPNELRGTLYRNGPARHEVNGFRYHHWFDGDGMVHAFDLSEDGLQHHARIVGTRKYQAEIKAGRALYPAFGSVPADPAPVTSPDVMNTANISVLPHHGKLLALWEAGSAWEIDPETLEAKGAYSFSEQTTGVPFSAHPKVEPDGTLWNFGYLSGANLLVLWHIDASGRIVKMGKIPSDPTSMPHDFVVTRNHIVIMLPPFNFQHQNAPTAFLEAHTWQADEPTRILVVDKNDFSKHRWLELPAQWVFHYGNAWEDSQGVIWFDGARANGPEIMTDQLKYIMKGVENARRSTQHHQYRLNTKNWTISESPLLSDNIHSEFPVIDPRVCTQRYKRLVMMTSRNDSLPVHGQLNEVSCFNLESAKLNSYRYPDSQIPEEHLFVPRANSAPESEGWIVGTAHDWEAQSTVLNVFNVEAVDAGPIATATLPYAMPLGLHGKFVQH